MDPKVSIIMGSTSDLPVMEKAAKVLNDFAYLSKSMPSPLTAHRRSGVFCQKRTETGYWSYHRRSRNGRTPTGCYRCHDTNSRDRCSHQRFSWRMDALLAIAQMPPGIRLPPPPSTGPWMPVFWLHKFLAIGDNALKAKIVDFKESLKKKIVDANNELAKVKYDYKTNWSPRKESI